MRHAAEHLTPMTLEMGGKSPVIVDEHANLKLAARRIVFGKYINCGQTCVAPDYILCSSKVKDTFLQYVKEEIKRQFGEDPLSNPNYGKIINAKHFDRILGLIEDKKVIVGGNAKKETLQIAPTVMDHVTFEDAVMGEEIFGPIMPVIEYEKLDDALDQINARPHPLAFYLFTDSKEIERHVLSRCNFGGGCVNDTIVHLATSEMGFGGVGESGMGQYHGKTGFDTFTHYRSILTKKNWIDVSMRYQPYTDFNNKLLKMFLK
jgi:aldehyde dehydrogenase (NAD+)